METATCINGISVTTHWQGFNHTFFGGFGRIVRHDIKEGKSIHHETIIKSPARCPAIKTDGTHVAFINKGGHIMVARINGNDARKLADIPDDRGCIDWPEGDWIYFSHGGYSSEDSAHISRVNYRTKQSQHVATFIDPKRDNMLVRQWRWSISRDAKRLFTRVVDHQGDLMVYYGALFPVYLPEPESYPVRIAINVKGGKYHDAGIRGCQNSVSPSGDYALLGKKGSHETFTIRKFRGGEIRTFNRKSLSLDKNLRIQAFDRNRWSCNSDEWICLMAGSGFRACRYANQILFNWQTGESVVVTGQTGKSFGVYDSAGDFWLAA
jgi:hypothetical protein